MRPYFYPRSPCGERLFQLPQEVQGLHISIHALLAESDDILASILDAEDKFLSTLSLRRATGEIGGELGEDEISIHALLAESDQRLVVLRDLGWKISIHALLAESDSSFLQTSKVSLNFYPRSPCGERHRLLDLYCRKLAISIHALLAESDEAIGNRAFAFVDFYPRSPCGERPRQAGRPAGPD